MRLAWCDAVGFPHSPRGWFLLRPHLHSRGASLSLGRGITWPTASPCKTTIFREDDPMENFLERVEALEHHLRTLEAHAHAVERRLRWWRHLAWGLVVLSLVSLGWSSSSAQEERTSEGNRSLGQRLDDVEDVLRKLKKLLTHITIAKDNEGRLEIILSGVNLRIVNGLGRTDCGPDDNPIPDCPNGLGNLLVGYNEPRNDPTLPDVRTGSHNVVVGQRHNFSRFGGLLVGDFNEISGDFAVVSGGNFNTASGPFAVVSGGASNLASGAFAAVSGGTNHRANGTGSSISGGDSHTASGSVSWVSGGNFNTASGFVSAVSGGQGNTASGTFSSVSGGQGNTAAGELSSVSGGHNRTAEGEFDWVAGSLVEDEEG